MRADPDDAAFVEDDDPVGVKDRAHTLGDDHHRRVARLRAQCRSETGIGGCVERGEAVVEQVDGRASHKSPRDRQALALAARDVRAALGDLGLEAPGHSGDELGRLGDLERVPELLVGGLRSSEPQVVGHRAAEQVGLLGNDPDRRPRASSVPGRGHRGRRRARSPSSRRKARDQVQHRRLARPGASDDRRRLARQQRECQPVQHRLLAARVPEVDLLELAPARRMRGARGELAGR